MEEDSSIEENLMFTKFLKEVDPMRSSLPESGLPARLAGS